MTPNKQEQGLRGLDEKRRETLKRLGLGAAFVVPVVTSLSLDSLTIAKAEILMQHGSGIHKKPPQDCKPQCWGEGEKRVCKLPTNCPD
jgi:hypothetical protein